METFKENIGLGGLHNAIVVDGYLWDKKRNFHKVSTVTTVRRFNLALKNKERFSTERTLHLFEEKSPDRLKALCYRAKKSFNEGKALGDKDACHIGVLKA